MNYMQRGGIFDGPGVASQVEAGPSERVPQAIRPRPVAAAYRGFGAVGPADPMRPMPIGPWHYQGAKNSGIFETTFLEPSGRKVRF